MTDTPEDDMQHNQFATDEALIERLARAEAQAQGLEIEWLEDGTWQPYGIDAETGEKITFNPAQNRLFARTFLAMQREYERARGDIGNPITEQSQREIPEDWRKDVGCHAAKYGVAATLARYPHWTEREIHDAKREYTDQ